MAISNDFLDYVLDQFSMWGGVTARKMFGGAGLYRDGKMFALIGDDAVYFKVGDSNLADYTDFGSGPFKPFDNQSMVLKSYYELPIDILENPQELMAWAAKSRAIQKSGK